MLRKRKIAIAGILLVLSALLFSSAPVSGDSQAAFTDGTGDVFEFNYSGSLTNPTTCGDATTGYSHVDVVNVTWEHEQGLGYIITITTSAAFDALPSNTFVARLFRPRYGSRWPSPTRPSGYATCPSRWSADETVQHERPAPFPTTAKRARGLCH